MIDLRASRPTRFMSSPCPAIPTTSVPNMIGTMIDLIILRKTVDSGLRLSANVGNTQPMITPITIAIIIHDVSDTRLRFRNTVIIDFGDGWTDLGAIGGGDSLESRYRKLGVADSALRRSDEWRYPYAK